MSTYQHIKTQADAWKIKKELSTKIDELNALVDARKESKTEAFDKEADLTEILWDEICASPYTNDEQKQFDSLVKEIVDLNYETLENPFWVGWQENIAIGLYHQGGYGLWVDENKNLLDCKPFDYKGTPSFCRLDMSKPITKERLVDIAEHYGLDYLEAKDIRHYEIGTDKELNDNDPRLTDDGYGSYRTERTWAVFKDKYTNDWVLKFSPRLDCWLDSEF